MCSMPAMKARHLVLKLTLFLQNSLLMSLDFFVLPGCLLGTIHMPVLFPACRLRMGQCGSYRRIILFSNSFRCTYQIYVVWGRARSAEERSLVKNSDVVPPDLAPHYKKKASISGCG